jgi:hypothetical protein
MKIVRSYLLLLALPFMSQELIYHPNASKTNNVRMSIKKSADTVSIYPNAVYKLYLSPIVLKLVQQRLPKWKLPEPSTWDKFWFTNYKKQNTLVNYIAADFNGDRKNDYCLILKNKQNIFAVWVLQSDKKDYLPIKLYETSSKTLPIEIGLELIPKGKLNYIDFDNDKTPKPIDLHNPAIQVVFFETSAQTYYWKNGKYLSVTTGD